MTHTPTAPLSDLPRIIRENLDICRKHDVANATLVLSREMLEELDGLIRGDGDMKDECDKLLPCPFCGGIPTLTEHPAHTHLLATFMPDHPGSWTIECCGLGCSAAVIAETKAEVLSAWNARAVLSSHAVSHDLLRPMEWQSAVGDGRMNNDWQLYVDGSLRRYIENRFEILERRIAELEKLG